MRTDELAPTLTLLFHELTRGPQTRGGAFILNSGDVGLLDTEKNYMIVVTKEGKLVTVDFNQKTKVTELKPSNAKMSDIGLGSSAAVQYTKKGEKNYLNSVEFTPAKGGD